MPKFFYHSKKRLDSIIERAADYIVSIKHEKIKTLTAEDVAAKVDKNIIFLSFVFKIVQKLSISNFILREKLHRAYDILEKDQDISILDISEKLGFADVEVFEEEFEKRHWIKPLQFQDIKGKITD